MVPSLVTSTACFGPDEMPRLALWMRGAAKPHSEGMVPGMGEVWLLFNHLTRMDAIGKLREDRLDLLLNK